MCCASVLRDGFDKEGNNYGADFDQALWAAPVLKTNGVRRRDREGRLNVCEDIMRTASLTFKEQSFLTRHCYCGPFLRISSGLEANFRGLSKIGAKIHTVLIPQGGDKYRESRGKRSQACRDCCRPLLIVVPTSHHLLNSVSPTTTFSPQAV